MYTCFWHPLCISTYIYTYIFKLLVEKCFGIFNMYRSNWKVALWSSLFLYMVSERTLWMTANGCEQKWNSVWNPTLLGWTYQKNKSRLADFSYFCAKYKLSIFRSKWNVVNFRNSCVISKICLWPQLKIVIVNIYSHLWQNAVE